MDITSIKTVQNLRGKRVLVRADFNVPVKGGKVLEPFKIQKSLPTIQYLMKKGARVILMSHLGRPKGYDKKLSLKPVQTELQKLLKTNVRLLPIKKTDDFRRAALVIEQSNNGAITLLDNVRFLPGEEANDKEVAKALASLADIFVLDGFAVAHRDSASVSGVARVLPSYAGLLLFEEISVLSSVMEKPKRPLVVILGGAKVETKIPVLKHLLPKADYVLVSGGIANTYWWARGSDLGASLIGKEFKKEVLAYCSKKKAILPVDMVVGTPDGKRSTVISTTEKFKMPAKDMVIRDIGPATVELFSSYMKKAKTLVWNGAMGVFEVSPYEKGTHAISRLFAAQSRGKALGVCGGGETVQVFQKLGILDDIDLVSTGGGAMLEFLSGKKLPGIEALRKASLKRKKGTR